MRELPRINEVESPISSYLFFASEPILHYFSFDTVPLNKITKRGSECRCRLNKR